MPKPYLLGIDTGLAHLGYALCALTEDFDLEVIREVDSTPKMGCFVTKKSDKKKNVRASSDVFRRGQEMGLQMLRLLDPSTGFVPEDGVVQGICVEGMSLPRNASACMKIGVSWGLLCMMTLTPPLPVTEATPKEIKKTLCGKNNASKKEVQEALAERFDLDVTRFKKTEIEHPFDALGAVVACMDSEVIRAIWRTCYPEAALNMSRCRLEGI